MELNREQIIKALECCTDGAGECDDCPLIHDNFCGKHLLRNALSLIKELTEEKERLESYAEKNDSEWREIYADSQAKWEQAYEKLEAEKDRLHTEKSRLIEEYEAEVKITKSDTVRKMHSMLCEGRVSNDTVVIVANQIAKEMLEGT